MSDWSGTAAVLLSLREVMNGGFRELRGRLPDRLHPQGPELHLFEGFAGTDGAGVDVTVTARHADGRQLRWMIEIWVDRQASDDWYATVKGEIDLDDDEGDDFCVLNEQRTVADGDEAAEAIRELGAMVVDYPLTDLLTKRWWPNDHDFGDVSGSRSARASAPSPSCDKSRTRARRADPRNTETQEHATVMYAAAARSIQSE